MELCTRRIRGLDPNFYKVIITVVQAVFFVISYAFKR